MTLIKSISGIRGTIGGKPGEGLSPVDIVKFVAAFAHQIKSKIDRKRHLIVVGRDARISGQMVNQLVCGTLSGMGMDVLDIGLATTPATEMEVVKHQASGGIIITASHNPGQWNALKLLDFKGEFIDDATGREMLRIAENETFEFSPADELGTIKTGEDALKSHVDKILELPLVNKAAIAAAGFSVVVDAVNSVGGIAIPYLLERLGVNKITKLYCEPNGKFPHNPEPLPENLNEISKLVAGEKADLGIVVDPDVDRLVLVCEDGSMFGEEYTLVAVSDYILKNKKGNTVSNLSSSRALKDITQNYGAVYFPAAVGEVNVVAKMKEVGAVIGGEGNGGIIYPDLHYGRDALVGVALFLSHLALSGKKCSVLRKEYPDYYMSKNKIELKKGMDVDAILAKISEKYKNQDVELNTIDGVKVDFRDGWVQLRKSNTEPIIRVYSESKSVEEAALIAGRMIEELKSLIF
ncbi:MAG: phosphoglucosamine mutase [Bacteroidales bacterium]